MIDRHALEVIEFDKVRRQIAEHATSSLGREAVEAIEPADDERDVRRSLETSDEMARVVRWDDPLPMGGVKDIRAALLVARRAGAALAPDALLDLAGVIRASTRLRSWFESRAAKYPRLWDIASALEECRGLVEHIDRAIDPGGFVADSASPKLARLRRELDQARAALRTDLEHMLARLDAAGAVNDRLIALRSGRPVIPVKASHKNSVPGIVHDQSATGQTLFVEPFEAVEESNRIRQIELAEMHEIERILIELTDRVRDHLPALDANVVALREIDARFAIGAHATQFDSIAPRISDDGAFELVRMRHPLLDARLRREKKSATPISCRLAASARLLVVSGPNAGGKTVALKTIGLAVAMTQAGFLIPADHLTALPIFGRLFAEIGDEQSIEQDLSTFTSRMGHLARISDEADSRTLILVDELGSATDPDQGAALGRAILDRWAERGALAIATTHLGNLKEYAHEKPWAVNASMEFDRATLRPTFRLIVGRAGFELRAGDIPARRTRSGDHRGGGDGTRRDGRSHRGTHRGTHDPARRGAQESRRTRSPRAGRREAGIRIRDAIRRGKRGAEAHRPRRARAGGSAACRGAIARRADGGRSPPHEGRSRSPSATRTGRCRRQRKKTARRFVLLNKSTPRRRRVSSSATG